VYIKYINMATVKLFQEKRDKTKNKNGEFPIYVRISHQGKKKERSLREFVFERNWKDQRIHGKSLKALNDKIQKVKGELTAVIVDLERNDIEPMPSVVFSHYDELKKTQYSINIVNKTHYGWKQSLTNWFQYIEEHNKRGTIDNSRQFKNKFTAFTKSKRVPIKQLV
jgi:Arm domain-containing DNA-binding protein